MRRVSLFLCAAIVLAIVLAGCSAALKSNTVSNAAANASQKVVPVKSVTFKVGSRTAYVDGREVIMDVEPMVINGQVMVPLRYAMEPFGAKFGFYPGGYCGSGGWCMGPVCIYDGAVIKFSIGAPEAGAAYNVSDEEISDLLEEASSPWMDEHGQVVTDFPTWARGHVIDVSCVTNGFSLSASPLVINGRTFIPAEAFKRVVAWGNYSITPKTSGLFPGLTSIWDPHKQTVTIKRV